MAKSSTRLILASTSPTRAQVLRAAGLCFATAAPQVDERAATAGLTNAIEIARALAARKSLAVAGATPDALVIGADQTLECDGRLFHKPETCAAAAAQLRELAGREHRLHSAIAVSRSGTLAWQHLSTVRLAMRPLGAAEIDRYLERAGPAVLHSVGAYQVEGLGIQLFERIDGDWFAILGLPLLPLLTYLRSMGGCEL
jgi:septum formation protein